MRLAQLITAGLIAATTPAFAQQPKAPAKAPPGGPEVRYFTALDGLMDGNADVILKETRQGKSVTAATLDVCYPAASGTERKERFVLPLAISGPALSGSGETQIGKQPVSVKLTRKGTADGTEFKGQIVIGPRTIEVDSTDNPDISESEFRDNQPTPDTIVAAPKDFTEVSPEAVSVRVKLEALNDFVKSLRGEPVEVLLYSLTGGCDALRSGEQTVSLAVNPDRAADVIAKAKAAPGVVNAGWSGGLFDMERTVRFPAAEYRDGGKINRDRIAATVGRVFAEAMGATLTGTTWDDATGKLKLTMKRPYDGAPGLGLTEKLELTAMVAADRPGASEHLIVWAGSPTGETVDETSGARLNLSDPGSGDQEGDYIDDNDAIVRLAAAFKAQRFDSNAGAWK